MQLPYLFDSHESCPQDGEWIGQPGKNKAGIETNKKHDELPVEVNVWDLARTTIFIGTFQTNKQENSKQYLFNQDSVPYLIVGVWFRHILRQLHHRSCSTLRLRCFLECLVISLSFWDFLHKGFFKDDYWPHKNLNKNIDWKLYSPPLRLLVASPEGDKVSGKITVSNIFEHKIKQWGLVDVNRWILFCSSITTPGLASLKISGVSGLDVSHIYYRASSLECSDSWPSSWRISKQNSNILLKSLTILPKNQV